MYTLIRNLTKDGRDRGLDYKITGFSVPPESWDGQVIDAIKGYCRQRTTDQFPAKIGA